MDNRAIIAGIDKFLDDILPVDLLLKRIGELEFSTEKHCTYELSGTKIGSDEIHFMLSIYREGRYPTYTNYLNAMQSLYVPAHNIKRDSDSVLMFTTDAGEYQTDTLSAETSIEELEEFIFNMTLIYGNNDIDVMKILLIYVAYKKYSKVIPDFSELEIIGIDTLHIKDYIGTY